jgi:hypothetical protein
MALFKKRCRHEIESAAEDALAAAREMVPGEARNEALKAAGRLRRQADTDEQSSSYARRREMR